MVNTAQNRPGVEIKKRRIFAFGLHYAIRPLGYLEFTDIYKINLGSLPALRVPKGYTIGHASADDIDYIVKFLKRDQPSHVNRTLWSQGHRCFVAKYDGQTVAYDWIAFASVQEEEYRIELRANHAFCLNAYTVPKHRGQGLHPA